jgi:hypothetical protein
MIRTTRRAVIAGLLIAAGVASAPAQQIPPVQAVTAQNGMVVAQESRAAATPSMPRSRWALLWR